LNGLPKLSELEQAHSDKLSRALQNKITQSGGKIPFSDFMNACLYAPGLGYYSAGAAKFGQSGDFVTAPEISDLFGQCLAEYYAQFKKINFNHEALSIIELGAGTGKLAGDILTHLSKINTLPERYYILEISGELKQRQKIYLEKILPDYIQNIIWLDNLDKISEFNGNGLILANEVLDALPVELFKLKRKKNNQGIEIYQQWIINNPSLPQKFEEISLLADKEFEENLKSNLQTNLEINLEDLLQALNTETPEYQSEINLNLESWLSGIDRLITKGQMLFIDYGFGAREYYHPSRHMGTLMCHFKHRAHGDFLANIGLQDITAHVNFTQVAMAAKNLELTIDNYTTQAEFLLSQNLGPLAEVKLALSGLSHNPTAQQISIANQIQVLTAPHEMGELFKVLILQKGDLDSMPSGRPHFHRL
jgi:SAM-dependent MidA family methyltransferase